MRGVAAILLIWLLAAPLAAAQTSPPRTSPLADWRAVVIAGDWRATDGRPIRAFDNAIRDVAAGLEARGVGRIDVFTLRPDATPKVTPDAALLRAATALGTPSERGGCLFYLTSHGSTEGVVFGDAALTPGQLAILLRRACGERPTVAVVSACYSGVFLGALAAPNRMVLTAARPDRNSFGCGEDQVYPFFDGCLIESLPMAQDLLDLARLTRTCVVRREAEEGAMPPSEPQLRVGATLQLLAPTLRFAPTAP
ncbi:MAG: C13 family peptidase [Brevundimonas sp.]|jgi:hypothetical protein|uniref:C13 family peptidase n=1 Tax=Brevundimonas sp. TaxID=1871086 RepID=UPI0022C5CE92|nr:C13 family peptidase [Brevundimonas sp.]MCZ8087117.1 peptidase C13 [Brevundimonas sp.]MCZ8193107.1 peptidase C13 [Brevundimonas sp.]